MPLPVAVPAAPVPGTPVASAPTAAPVIDPAPSSAAPPEGQKADSAPDTEEDPQASGDETPGTDDDGAPADQHDPGRQKSRGVQKRLDEFRRQVGDLQRQNDQLLAIVRDQFAGKSVKPPSQAPQDGPPDRSSFETYDEYVAALTQYNVGQSLRQVYAEAQRLKQQEAAAEQEARWQAKQAEAAKKYEDFEEKVLTNEELDITEVMASAIRESDLGTEVAYFLANNPDLATKIASLPPTSQVREIGKIEARIEGSPASAPKAKRSSAPAPIVPVTPAASNNPFDLSKAQTQAEYESMRAAQMKATGAQSRW